MAGRRKLAQLAVLVFIFGKVLNLNIKNYPVFVFVGLTTWAWFPSGISGAATSVLAQRHLVMQPRLPSSVLPMVAVAVPLVDVLALPVLVLMVALSSGLSWGLLACPLLLALQFAFLVGHRVARGRRERVLPRRAQPDRRRADDPLLPYAGVYAGSRVPERFRWVIDLNPLATMIEAYRSLLLNSPGPGAVRLGAVALAKRRTRPARILDLCPAGASLRRLLMTVERIHFEAWRACPMRSTTDEHAPAQSIR